MFCPECGKENEKGSKFCEQCGTKIETEKTEEVKEEKAPRKPMAKKTKIIIGIVAVVIVLLIIVFSVLSGKYKPSKVAEDYFLAVVNQDADKLYQYLDVKNSGVTSKKVFREVFSSDSKKELVNYSVASSTESTDGLSATVTINYTLKDSSKALTSTIDLVKDKKKNFLFFDNWTISEKSSMTTENYKLYVPKGASLKLEGIDIDKKYLSKNSDSDYDVYEIPELFRGEYDATVVLKNGITLKDELNVSSYSSSRLTNLEVSDKDKKNIEKELTKTIPALYQSAIENKSFNDIKETYNYKGADLSNLEKSYTSFAKSISSSGLISLKVSDVDVESSKVTSDGYIKVTAEVDYEYTVKALFGSEETKTNKTNRNMFFELDYFDGNYKLVNISSMATYFSRF